MLFQAANLTIGELYPYSLKTMEFSTYYFNLIINASIVKGDYLQIDFPSQFIFPLSSSYEGDCVAMLNSGIIPQKCLIRNMSIYIYISFSDDYVQMNKSQSLSFIINDIRNPHTLSITSSFNISLKDSMNNLIATNYKNFSIQMQSPSEILSFSVYPLNPRIRMNSSYHVTFNLVDIMKPNDIIIFELPYQLIIDQTNPLICTPLTNGFSIKSCTAISDLKIQIISQNYVEFNTTIDFIFNQISNPYSVISVSPFKIYIIESNSSNTYSSQIDLEGFSGYQPFNLTTSSSITYENNYIGEPNTLFVSIKLLMAVPKEGSIIIQASDNMVPTLNLECKTSQNMNCSRLEINSIIFSQFDKDISQNSILNITIKSFKNPLISRPIYPNIFYIRILDDNYHSIGIAQILKPEPFICASNCNTCDFNYSNCTQCNPRTYFLNGNCLNNCPNNFFVNGSYCARCNTPNECIICNPDDISMCVQCAAGYVQYKGTCFPDTSDFRTILNLNFSNNNIYDSNNLNSNSSKKGNSSNSNNGSIIFNSLNPFKTPEQEIIFYDTYYDNKPYLTAYVVFSMLFIILNKLAFRNKSISPLSSIIFLWCILDVVCMLALIIKFIFIEYYLYLLCLLFILAFQLVLHFVVCLKFWKIIRKEAAYIINLESNSCFKFPHIITFCINYRFSYLFFSGIGKYGNVNFNTKTRPELLKILSKSLKFNILCSITLIILLACFIAFRNDANEEIPWFFIEYITFLILYVIVQILRICFNPKPFLNKYKPTMSLDVFNIENKESPKNVGAPKKSIIAAVLDNLTSGKRKKFENVKDVKNKIENKIEISHSPLLPPESSSRNLKNGQNEISFNLSSLSPSTISYNFLNFLCKFRKLP